MKLSQYTMGLGMLVGCVLVAAPVQATTLGTADLISTHFGANDAITVYGAGYAGQEIYSGVYMLTKMSGTGGGDTWSDGTSIPGFCVEAEQLYPNNVTHYDLVTTQSATSTILGEPVGLAKAGLLSELWGRYYDSSWADGSYPASENNAASAFGAAVWEIIYEDLPSSVLNYNVGVDNTAGVGGFASTTVNQALANSWLHSLDGTGPMADLAIFTSDTNQNYLVAVPEPMTILLLGLGGALSVARKRRRIVT